MNIKGKPTHKLLISPMLLFIFSMMQVHAGAKLMINAGYTGDMTIAPIQVEQKGDSLYLIIDFNLEKVSVQSRHSIHLYPVLTTEDREKVLPEIEIKGKSDYLDTKREYALMNKAQREWVERHQPYAVIKGFRSDDNKHIQYVQTIAYEPWMKEARLVMRQDLCGCGDPAQSSDTRLLADRIKVEVPIDPYTPTLYLSYMRPEAEPIKNREVKGEINLNFEVGKTTIRPDYMDNKRELSQLSELMETVHRDSDIMVKGITIVGYASPEGSAAISREF